jgi:hypothetical protein
LTPKGGKERETLDTIKDSYVGRCPPQSDDYQEVREVKEIREFREFKEFKEVFA